MALIAILLIQGGCVIGFVCLTHDGCVHGCVTRVDVFLGCLSHLGRRTLGFEYDLWGVMGNLESGSALWNCHRQLL